MQHRDSDRPHHHGDLRNALIEAGLAILESRGLEGLTLRACAASAGVSHAAPAHHFGGLDGLLQAIAARGFARFAATMRDHRARAGDDAHARLVAICEGYMEFALTSPALFRLIFGRSLDAADSTELKENSEAAFQVLAETCAPFKPPGETGPRVELTVWSLVHGLASLRLAGCTPPTGAGGDSVEIRDLLAALSLPLPR